MDHTGIIASLTRQQREDLTSRSDVPGVMHLAGHLGFIGLTGTLIALGVPGWWLLLPVQGILLVFVFTLQHETVHLTPFRTYRLNVLAGWFCAIVLCLPWNWFKYFHFAHHRHTQDRDKDPELASPKPETVWQFVRHVSGLPVWWSHLKTLLRNAAGRCDDDFVPERGRGKVVNEARVLVLVYLALAAAGFAMQSALLVWVWLVPLLLGQPFLRVYLLAEHGRCPMVANMLENSRTTFTNAIVRFLAWNMPYHAEHHAYPAVPFHKLPAFHALTRAHLKVTERGYVRFARKTWAALRRYRQSDGHQ